MKKILTALTIAILAIGCSPKMAFYHTPNYDGLKQKVDSTTTVIYEAKADGNKYVKDYDDYQIFTQIFTKKGEVDSTKHRVIFLKDETEFTNTNFDIRKGDTYRVESVRTVWGKPRTTLLERVNGNKKSETLHFYDFENNVDTISVKYDYPNQTKVSTTQDHLGNLRIETTVYKDNREQSKTNYVNGEFSYSMVYTYDDKGLLLSQEVKELKNAPYIIEYKYPSYDSHNNWIVQEAYIKGVLRSVTERKLGYR